MTHKNAALFDSSNVRSEGNSVIFINGEILPDTEDAFVSHFNDNEGFQRSILLKIIIGELLLFIFDMFYFLDLKSTMGGIGALRTIGHIIMT